MLKKVKVVIRDLIPYDMLPEVWEVLKEEARMNNDPGLERCSPGSLWQCYWYLVYILIIIKLIGYINNY